MKAIGWLLVWVLCAGLFAAGELEAAWGPLKLRKSGPNYTARPYKYKKWKAPKAGKVRKWTR